MATGNTSKEATTVCSICLEPYKERNPKLLPCFHTVCLPCLKDLEQHHTVSSDAKGGKDDKKDNRPLTFPCPTCRATITVPPGGVIQFQANFYLKDEALACDICDVGNEATYSCTECGHNMCDQCQRCHNKFHSSHQVELLTNRCQQYSQHNIDTDTDCEVTREQQLAVLEAAQMAMKDQKESLQRERQVVGDVISRRAEEISLKAKGSEDGNKQIKFTSTFPCPSCRAVIPVPAGGVAELQDNFDLNHEPLTCKVCDQPRKAVYICIDCCHTMCAQCQRCHEKFTSNHRIQPLTSRCIQSSRNTSLPKSVEAITDHLTVLEAALVTMREEEDTLQREMLTVADVISRRADVMRALVTQAERNSQRALAELTNRLGKQIQEEMVSAREKQTVILQLLEHSSTGRQSPVSSNEILIRFLLKKEDYQHYRQRNKSKRLKFLIPQFIDSAIDEQDISSYIGTVCDSNQYPEETNDSPIRARKCGESEAAIKIQSDMQEGTSSSEQQVPDMTASGMYKRSLSLAELASDIAAVKSQLMGMQTFISSFSIMHTDKRENDDLEKQMDNLKARFYRIEEDMMRTKSNIVNIPKNLEVLKKKLLIIDKKILGIQLEVQNLETCSKGYRRKGSHQLLRMTRKPLSVPSLPYKEKVAYS